MDNTVELPNKRAWVLGLACECPFGEKLSTCCLGEIRKKHLKARINLVKNMSEEELDRIITDHKKCLVKRERRRLH